MPSEKKDTVSFRIGPSLNARLAAMSDELGFDKSHLVREAIERYLDAVPGSIEQRLRRLEQQAFQGGGKDDQFETERLREELAEAHARLSSSELLKADITKFIKANNNDPAFLVAWIKFLGGEQLQ